MNKNTTPLFLLAILAIGGAILGYFFAGQENLSDEILFNTASATGAIIAMDDNITFCASGSIDSVTPYPIGSYLIIDVLNNDQGTGTYVNAITIPPTHGVVRVIPATGTIDNQIAYVFNGLSMVTSDSFEYEACVGTGGNMMCDTALVTITFDINCQNQCSFDEQQECMKDCVNSGLTLPLCTLACADCNRQNTTICGDNMIQTPNSNGLNEVCDGIDLNNQTCITQGFIAGTLGCNDTCTDFDTSDCVNSICGNNTIETGEECDDGNTVPNDGCSATCQREYLICQLNQTCAYQSSNVGVQCNQDTDCDPANSVCGNNIIEAGEECDDDNTVSNDGCSSTCQLEYLKCQPNQTCGYQATSAGTDCTSNDQCVPDPLCGNGDDTDAGEECDDGNNDDNDGCSATCQLEYLRCQSDDMCGYQTDPSGSACSVYGAQCGSNGAICGNSIIEAGEECDVGDTNSNDGCSSTCQLEYLRCQSDDTCGYQTSTAGTSCTSDSQCDGTSTCGNNIVETGEQCDDGDTDSNDGCSSTCQLEYLRCQSDDTCGYQTDSSGESCNTLGADCDDSGTIECGDGHIDGGEECDDDNDNDGDGCSSSCQNERPSCFEVDIYGPVERSSGIYVRLEKDDNDRPLKIKDLDWGDGDGDSGPMSLPESHYYQEAGEYDIEYTVFNINDTSLSRDCNETVIINTIEGCTDPDAYNYDPNATEDDGSCEYGGGNSSCASIQFNVTNSHPSTNETIFFSWNTHNIDSAGFYAGAGNFINDATSPVSYSYSYAGEYTAQLIIVDNQGNTKTCTRSVSVGNAGCTHPKADNFNPDAISDDGSCTFNGGNQVNCGDRKLQIGEECDDGNGYNGDGCDTTCQIEPGFAPYCGNNIVELGEQCDGDFQCNSNCQTDYSGPDERLQDELCRLYGNCSDGGSYFPTVPLIPVVGPDEERVRKQFLSKGIEMVDHPEIDTSSIEWYEDIDQRDNRFVDPIHWVQEILPAPYRQAESFLVAPSIGTVTSIQTIQDKEILTNFLVGNIEGYQEYLQEGAVYYPFTPLPGQQGNTVLFGHSSSYKLPAEVQEKEPIGNVFKLIPLMKRGDYFYLVTRQGRSYTIHQYQVSDKKIVEPSEVSVIEQNIVGHQATLVTCYPIGSFEQRYIVQGAPVSTMKNVSYNELLDTLTMKQEIQLRNIAESYRKAQHETSPQLMINKIQQARKSLINQHNTPAEQKQRKDSAWQYLLYHMSL